MKEPEYIEIERLQSELNDCLAALRLKEWDQEVHDATGRKLFCSRCGRFDDEGHTSYCDYAKPLQKGN